MSQNDLNIANQGFPSFRSDLNDALQALASNSSGATEPATTYAGQFWYDSTNDVLKFRNEANSAWIDPPIAGLVQALSDLGVTASAAELNKMDGVTATTTEINYVDGVTSNIQTQLNAKGVGDITGVTAGTNLTGGGASGSVTVNLTASPNITSLSVGSSEVISSARQLKNIASVDAATVAALGAAGVGGGGVPLTSWDVTDTPDVTFTSSGTWTKPSNLSDDALIVFLAVGAGASGSNGFYSYGGGGAAAAIVTGTIGELPSTVSIVVGAGPVAPANSGASGGDTTVSGGGATFTAKGGSPSYGGANGVLALPPVTNYFTSLPTSTEVNGTAAQSRNSDGQDNVYGGGGGGGGYIDFTNGGTSTYSGNGGNGGKPTAGDGQVPGGGGGGSNTGSGMGSGGNGSVRIWYVTS